VRLGEDPLDADRSPSSDRVSILKSQRPFTIATGDDPWEKYLADALREGENEFHQYECWSQIVDQR
jgi:hypothetical protein